MSDLIHLVTLSVAIVAALYARAAYIILRDLAAPEETMVVNPSIQLEQEGTSA